MPSKTLPHYAFAITGIYVQCFGTTLEIQVTTNLPRHLFYYYQQFKPPTIATTYPNRLSTRRHSQDISFVSEGGRDQLEPGDTLIHTFFVEVDADSWELWGYWLNSNPTQLHTARSPMVHLTSQADCGTGPIPEEPSLAQLDEITRFDFTSFTANLAWQPPPAAHYTQHILTIDIFSTGTATNPVRPPLGAASISGDLITSLIDEQITTYRNTTDNRLRQHHSYFYTATVANQFGPQFEAIHVLIPSLGSPNNLGTNTHIELVCIDRPAFTLRQTRAGTAAFTGSLTLPLVPHHSTYASRITTTPPTFSAIPPVATWSRAQPPIRTATWTDTPRPGTTADGFPIWLFEIIPT